MGRSLRKQRKIGNSQHEYILQREKLENKKSKHSIESKNEHRYWLSEADRLFGPQAEVQVPKSDADSKKKTKKNKKMTKKERMKERKNKRIKKNAKEDFKKKKEEEMSAESESDSDVEMDDSAPKSKTRSLWHARGKPVIKKRKKLGNVRGNKENRNLMTKVMSKEEKAQKRRNAGIPTGKIKHRAVKKLSDIKRKRLRKEGRLHELEGYEGFF